MDVRKSVLVPHPAESMFDLIEAAEHYPAFVPGCRAAVITERSDEIVAARLTLRQAGLALELETRNPKRRPTWMAVHLTRGPFRRFHGEWRLTPLNASACRIDFTLSYEFDGMAARLAARMFDRIADNLVDAFVERAARVLPAPRAAEAAVVRPGMAPAEQPAPAVVAAPSAVPATISDQEPPMTDTFLYDTLRSSRLAAELNDEQCRLLASAMELRELNQGDLLVREGEPDEHFYLVASGMLGVVKNAGTDDQVTLSTRSPGDFAGELSWLDGEKRYASLIAVSKVRVLGLERTKLEGLLSKDPLLVYRVMRAIVRVVHQLQRGLWMQQSELTNYIYKQHGRY
jgi:ribosome-associated toxin RatA of RatAB toxin-antitoxin module/CRP-like cAMP-binding protein